MVVVVQAPGRIFSDETLGDIYALTQWLERNPEVARVQSLTPAGTAGAAGHRRRETAAWAGGG